MTEVTFVYDCLVEEAVAKAQPPQDEYETDLEDDFSDTDGKDFAPTAVSWTANTRLFLPRFIRYAYSSQLIGI